MMDKQGDNLMPTLEELKLGFEVKTLQYPVILPFFGNTLKGENFVYDRTVVLELDEEHRVRRRALEQGYILEEWNGIEWVTSATYASLTELESDDFIKKLLANKRYSTETLEVEEDEDDE